MSKPTDAEDWTNLDSAHNFLNGIDINNGTTWVLLQIGWAVVYALAHVADRIDALKGEEER